MSKVAFLNICQRGYRDEKRIFVVFNISNKSDYDDIW